MSGIQGLELRVMTVCREGPSSRCGLISEIYLTFTNINRINLFTHPAVESKMVTFSCEICNDSVLKKKAMQHFGKCPRAFFTCIDCSTTFEGTSFQRHTSCISEAQKYEGALYKGPKTAKSNAPPPKAQPKVESKKEEPKKEKPKKDSNKDDKLKALVSKLTEAKNKKVSMSKVVKAARKENVKSKDLFKQMTVTRNDRGELVLEMA